MTDSTISLVSTSRDLGDHGTDFEFLWRRAGAVADTLRRLVPLLGPDDAPPEVLEEVASAVRELASLRTLEIDAALKVVESAETALEALRQSLARKHDPDPALSPR